MTLKSPLKTTFQQIRPTLTLFLYPLDCLRDHGTGPDLSPHDRQTDSGVTSYGALGHVPPWSLCKL